MRSTRRALVAGGAVLVALLAGLALAALAGAGPATTIGALAEGMAGTPYAIGKSLNTAAVLMLVGAGFSLAHRAGLVNVGGEGQLCAGGIAATAVGTTLPAATPALVGVPLTLLAAFTAGGLWAAIAAVLLVRRGTSEIITTLLLNFVGLALVTLMVHEPTLLRQPVTSSETLPQSAPLVDGAHLPLLGVERSPATVAILLALIATAVIGVVSRHTPAGLRLRALGQSPAAAARLGVRAGPTRVVALSTAGAFAGLGGGLLVSTAPALLAEGFTSGFGFAGLVVGLLAGGSMLALTAAALLLAFLTSGGINLQLVAGVPSTTVAIIQSLIILLIAATATWAAGKKATR
ncbi:ABC transporter permease [Actinoplanes rectilineatus]|uniref:ABC transporter permease n=1 Tax=Actinoplanes rectilineatus TaxID=113571 RepID=UPI000699061C|nr:ABC transporter permease [Actinoplanes rectilineatus]